MLIPIRHEDMTARRWPVVTFALIALNVLAFVATHSAIEEQSQKLGPVKAHILMLAATHPDLRMPAEVQQFVSTFRQHNPELWAQIQRPDRQLEDGWDARLRLMESGEEFQQEMDALAKEYAALSASSITEPYGFVPAQPKPLSYLTAGFLHVGWLHLIGNLWFLWLAGFVLEDAWGRWLYTIVYVVAGAAALQFHAWTNPGSMVPTIGASGAVAALMGAFLVRFPKMKIEMKWFYFMFRSYTFHAPAYALLPLWLLMEVFYGAISGQMGGVAHWAHVGGFLFGAGAATALRFTGLEQKANQSIEAEIGWVNDPAIVEANELTEKGQVDEAIAVLNRHLESAPDSIDAANLLQQLHWRKGDTGAYTEAGVKLCALHLKARAWETAWQVYQELRQAGSSVKLPAGVWLDLCRGAEELGNYDAALQEYRKLAETHPAERQSLQALLGAAKLYLKKLNQPQEALKLYQAASASKVPHLDWETTITAGMREAKAALSAPAGSVAT